MAFRPQWVKGQRSIAFLLTYPDGWKWKWVDLRGFEPLTFCMPCRRAPSCATGPYAPTTVAASPSIVSHTLNGCKTCPRFLPLDTATRARYNEHMMFGCTFQGFTTMTRIRQD